MESWHIYQRLFNLGLIRNQANSKIIIWWVFFYSRENYFLLMQYDTILRHEDRQTEVKIPLLNTCYISAILNLGTYM